MSSIPAEVQRQIDEILKAIREHPKHEFGALRRREFYRAFGDDPVGKRARGWISVIAARRVLPIYEATVPPEMSAYDEVSETELQMMIESGAPYIDESIIPVKGMARRLVELAEGALQSSVELKFASDVLNNHYYYSLQVFYLFESRGGKLSPPTFFAIYAAYQALAEACGYEALTSLEEFHRSRDGKYRIFGSKDADDSKWVSATQLTDLEMAGSQPSDAAANAMAAYVLNFEAEQRLATKLAFWEWWLTEAMAQAWEKAEE